MKSKKGISLIVLIVTIIVIIILAAAVILTLNKNNPIDSSRIAQLADNRQSINSAVTLYYSKQMAATQGKYDANQIFTQKDVTSEDKALIGDPLVTTEKEGTTYYELTSDNVKKSLSISLPTIANAKWYLDVNTGVVYLIYGSKDNVPNWMYTDGSAKTTADSTLAEFVMYDEASSVKSIGSKS